MLDGMPVKTCGRGHPMTPDNIYGSGAGRAPVCKTCKTAAAAARREVNPEKIKAAQERASLKFRRSHGVQEGNANARKTHCAEGHEFTEANTYLCGPEGTRRQCRICRNKRVKESYRRHREKRLTESRARYAANPERYAEWSRRWQQENRERSNLLSRLKKQRRRNAGTLTVQDWELVLEVYGSACLACGKDEVTIDHVVPVFVGGLNEISNVQPLCGFCNTSKGTKTVDYRPFPWDVVTAEAEVA